MVTQPSVYSYSQIQQAALEVIRRGGYGAFSARSIAKELGSSTMPIYKNVKSIDKLADEVRVMANYELKEYQQKNYTDQVLLNLALGYVMFAKEEKNLFRYLYLDKPLKLSSDSIDDLEKVFLSDFGEGSPQAQALKELEGTGLGNLIKHTWIYTHGLATLANSGALDAASMDTILRMLKDAGEAFYIHSNPEIQKMMSGNQE